MICKENWVRPRILNTDLIQEQIIDVLSIKIQVVTFNIVIFKGMLDYIEVRRLSSILCLNLCTKDIKMVF